MKYPILAVALLAHFALADQITMKDGDRISGDIVKKDGSTVTVKSRNFGTVTLKWDDILTVRTDNPINVSTPDGKTVKANIETRGDQIQIGPPATPQQVPANDIVTLRNDSEQSAYERFLHPGLLDLWTITGSFGFAGAIGNAETSTFTTPVNFVRASNTTRTTAYFNSIHSTATANGINSETAQAVRGGWAYNRNLRWRNTFVNTFNDYEFDKFQSLDLRIVLGGGAGYQVWSKPGTRLAVVAGGAWNREAFASLGTSAAFTRNSAEAYWGDDMNYKLTSRINLVQSFRMFNNLSNGGEYRINFDTSATTQVTKWLTWGISLSDRFLSNPVPGRKNNDFLYSTSLGFQWAR